MKCEKISSRTLRVSDLPLWAEDGTEIAAYDIEIEIRYTKGGPYHDGIKAGALDHVIIPAIIKALGGETE